MSIKTKITYCFLFLIFSNTWTQPSDTLFQYSNITALLKGIYNGNIHYGEIKKHGNFGIGTFNQLDGEMIAVDNKFYQIKSDGKSYAISDSIKSPFACVVNFKASKSFDINKLQPLETILDSLLPSKNNIVAYKITGLFSAVKTRSIPAQQPPYKQMVEVAKTQSVFNFSNIEGIVVGFKFPVYMAGINVPGFHSHFISANFQTGGHILICNCSNIVIEVMEINNFLMQVPTYETNDAFTPNHHELHSVEK